MPNQGAELEIFVPASHWPGGSDRGKEGGTTYLSYKNTDYKLLFEKGVGTHNSPLEHLHVGEDGGHDEEDAHEDDVVGVDLLRGGRHGRVAVVAAVVGGAQRVRRPPLQQVDRPEMVRLASERDKTV